ADDFIPASDTFYIPETAPDIVITANTMTVRDGKAILEGNVKATRAGDILTCNRALVNSSPRWMLASLTPKLYRREAIPEQKVIREMNLEARNIFFDSDQGIFSASDSVHLRIEERSWDLATYTWTVITADDMLGFRDSKRMIFSGNVKVRDESRYGHGNRLDYLKERSLAILSGNAVLETQELNKKTNKIEPRILKGQKITYDTETRQAVSE
ncbi:MAG: LptA/OstA family protein, partial [Candidatus Riflebacteria bacterium]|nr:LptA/OstA family protein [Candidatus Riflebacteria bacterium]